MVVDGGDPAEESVGNLDAGKEREVRFDDVRLRKGTHTLAVTVDQKESGDDHSLKITAVCSATN